MYPKFLMHNERSYYIKINNSDGDGIFINYNMEIISTQEHLMLKELNELAPMELIEEGYIAIEKNFFFETYERVQNRHTRQLIL